MTGIGKIITRTSGIEALKLFKINSNLFDLVITDLTMPEMTGDELAKELIAVRHDITIILCAGFSKRITEDYIKSTGIRSVVTKPVIKREIAEAICKVLDEK